jgi:hypothetical protein
MESAQTLIAYVSVAILSIASTLGLLRFTKVPVIVVIVSASLATVAYMLYARLDLGFWDKFSVIAWVVCWFYALAVSLLILFIGRSLRWRLFVKESTDR